MQEKEPSILASLGIDPTVITPAPPDHVWSSAVQAAFDPSSVADPDTVPDMDDTAPDDSSGDDLDGLVVDDPGHDGDHTQQAGHSGDAHFGDVPAGSASGDGGDATDSADHADHSHADDPHADDTGGYDDHTHHDHDFGQDTDAGHDDI
jgi:hypothetical protein